MRTSPAAVVVVAFLFPLAGCDDDCVAPDGAESFEVGTGEVCFERVTDAATIPLMEGPQGGYHVFVAVGCSDCGTEVGVLTRALDAATGEELTPATSTIQELAGAPWAQAAGIRVSMPGEPDELDGSPRLPEGTAIVIEVELTDGESGSLLHATDLSVVLGETRSWDPCDSDPEGECCVDGCD